LLAPIDTVELLFYQRSFTASNTSGVDVLIIPLCNGVHFQGCVVEKEEKGGLCGFVSKEM